LPEMILLRSGSYSVQIPVWTKNFWSRLGMRPDSNRKWWKTCQRGFWSFSVWTRFQTRFGPRIFRSKPRIGPEPIWIWLKSCERGFRPDSDWTRSKTRFEPEIFGLFFGLMGDYTEESNINKGSNGNSGWHVQWDECETHG
jgi:hypothetical protein